MAVATSNTLPVSSRDDHVNRYLRSTKNRNPATSIEVNSPAWIRAMAIGDTLVMQSAQAQQLAAGVLINNQNEDQLIATGEILGIDWPQAVGASGSLIASTGTLGSTILAGDELKDQTTGFRYKVLTTALYMDGDPIPVQAIDTGPLTNVDPGIALVWSLQRPGCNATAVVKDIDGEGLTGGAEKASVEEYRTIIAFAIANESASGNEAVVIKLAQNSRAHGVAVQKAFAVPALNGPGLMGLCFTLKPANKNASRIPNGTQMAAVYAYVVQWLPGDDGVFMLPLLAQPLSFVWRIKWSAGDAGWVDAYPWPLYKEVSGVSDPYVVTATTDPSHFTVGVSSGNYTGASQPAIGKTISIFDKSTGKFFRKKILSFTGAGPWPITCDTTTNQTDTTYKPVVGDPVSPWADSLPQIGGVVADYIGSMGPGEQVATDPGDGRRQMRVPEPSPTNYPDQVTSLVVSNALKLPSVADAQEKNALGTKVPVGVFMTTNNLFEQPTVAVYPL